MVDRYRPDSTLDASLADLDDVDRVYYGSEPAGTTLSDVTTAALGYKDGTFGAAANASPNGRSRTFAAFVDGVQTGAGTATHWMAVEEGVAVHAIGELTDPVTFSGTGAFPSSAIVIRAPDAE